MLRFVSFSIVAGALLSFRCVAAQAPASPVPAGWRLVWADEFDQKDGSTIDPSKWSVVLGGKGFGNKELESYTDRSENLRQEHGNLVIEARREPYTGADGVARDYTSARIETRGKFEQTYGRFEARMKLPTGKGMWPAFWLLGGDIKAAGWPGCGEIDIMENIGDPTRIYGTLHGPGYSGSHGISAHTDVAQDQPVDSNFHIYSVEWSPEKIVFSVDGVAYATRTKDDLPAGTTWVYNHPFFILLNLAVGGLWPGYPDATTRFPQQMLVDYVRVYQPER